MASSHGNSRESDDAQNVAEQFDGNSIGERPPNDRRVDSGLPGVNAFSDRVPMNSEDPALLMGGSKTKDEIHTREWRERPDRLPSDRHEATRLLGAGDDERSGVGGPVSIDDEEQLLAEAFESQDASISAEEAALHID